MQSEKKSTTRPANAFAPHFLTRARRRDRVLREEGSSLDIRSLAAGPWDVESLDARCGRVHAVVRRGEPGERAKPLGFALHDGRRFVAHLAPEGPAAAPVVAAHLHVARHLAADLGSLALLHRSLGSEALVLLGRELMRRMG